MSHSSHQSGHRVRRSPGQWHKLFDEYRASGLSQNAFCAREGVAYASFCTWRRKLASSTIEAPVAHGLPAFVEVTPSTDAEPCSLPGWDIELALGDEVVLRLRRR